MTPQRPDPSGETRDVATGASAIGVSLRPLRPYFAIAGFFSFLTNMLYLSSPLYLLQIYNRVLVSESIPTLLALTVILTLALGVMASLEAFRGHILVRCSVIMDMRLAQAVLQALLRKSARAGQNLSAQTLRELDELRAFLTGPGINFLFDLPWTPIYLGLLFLIHPVLGVVATLGAAVVLGLAVLNEYLTRPALERAQGSSRRAYTFADNLLQHADAVQAMSMGAAVGQHWQATRGAMMAQQSRASERNASAVALTRFLRLLLQSLLLGTGAWLVIDDAIQPATIFAASIIMSRALLPIEQAVGAWRHAIAARIAYRKVNALLAETPVRPAETTLHSDQTELRLEHVGFRQDGAQHAILHDASLTLSGGQVLAIVGASGAGKTSLAKLLVGALQPDTGQLWLGGIRYDHWDPALLGGKIGYLPQDVGLIAGTVRDNISRFQKATTEQVVAAARLAGIHDMITGLPRQYDTLLGPGGTGLSGGQRQRLGLARALFGDPRLIILDEPNAHLDQAGQTALQDAIGIMRDRGAAIIIITHLSPILQLADRVLQLQDARLQPIHRDMPATRAAE